MHACLLLTNKAPPVTAVYDVRLQNSVEISQETNTGPAVSHFIHKVITALLVTAYHAKFTKHEKFQYGDLEL